MGKFIDLTGMRFGRLLVINKGIKSKIGEQKWNCQCDCGNKKEILGYQLRKKGTKSCGCLNREVNSKRSIGNKFGEIHGLSYHPLRFIRKSMLHRCYNKNNPYYKNYGGRGIKVCEKWKSSLPAFYEWAINNKWIKGLSIDRIDNQGDYTPENCHFITISENSRKNCILGKEVGKGRKKRNNSSSQI
jgi:hypothetical protein